MCIAPGYVSHLMSAGGLFDERFTSGSMSQLTENVFRYAIWRVNQQPRGRKFVYDIQTVPAPPADNSFHTATKGRLLFIVSGH